MLNGCWTAQNRAALEELLGREYKHAPIAVFDWDNTCIRGDISALAFHQLCEDLSFRFDTPGFCDWITEPALVGALSAVYEEYRMRRTPENCSKLRLGLEQLREALYEGEDDGAVCAWEVGAFIGWTLSEVRAFIRQVIARELVRPMEIERLELDGEHVEFVRGLRMRPELIELVRLMQRAGWQVWAISASAQWLVAAAAEFYGIPASKVVGMRREIVDGRITRTMLPPVSFSDGKLDAYQMFISRTQPPTFAAGDSLYDWKVLEWAEEARLLVEPTPAKLRDFALWRASAGETWLFQQFE